MAGSYSKAAYRPRPARPNDDPAPNILAREFNGYAPRTHLASDPAYVRVGASWSYVCLPGGLANRQIAGHSVEVGHDTDLVLAAFAALPPDGHPGAPHGPRRRVRRRKDGAHARRVRYHAFPFQARQPVRQRGGGIHRPSHQEGTHVRQRLHERGTAALGPEQVRVVVRPPAAPLDPRLHESRGVHATRKDPPGTVQHTVANPRARRAL